MFTGIVQGTAPLVAVEKKPNLMTIGVQLPQNKAQNLEIGASIALNGTCLTVTKFSATTVYFDIIAETLELTNLGYLIEGSFVNFERAAKFGDEIGGHLLSGHISDTISLENINKDENHCVLTFSLPKKWQKYILPKGFVALNGCSLTIASVNENTFTVSLIPETLRATTFATLEAGAPINLEIDPQTQAIVDTVENYLAKNNSN